MASAFAFGALIERLGYGPGFVVASACIAAGAVLLWRAPMAAHAAASLENATGRRASGR